MRKRLSSLYSAVRDAHSAGERIGSATAYPRLESDSSAVFQSKASIRSPTERISEVFRAGSGMRSLANRGCRRIKLQFRAHCGSESIRSAPSNSFLIAKLE